MPVINGVYTKDFPNLGRTPADADLIPIAEVGNQVTYKTTVGTIFNAKISGTTGRLSKFTGSNTIGNSILNEIGNAVHLTNLGSSFASFGIINPGTPGDPGVDNDAYIGSTINNDFLIRVNNTEALRVDTALRLKIANIQSAITDTDKFLVSDGGIVKYRSGLEMLSDLGAVPYTGATNDVDLGVHDLTSNAITLNPAPSTIPTSQGSMYFDSTDQTVAAVLNGTIMKIGEDLFFQIKNQTGSTIPKGTAVRFDGVVGASGRVLAVPFIANGSVPSIYFLGVTSEDIPNGGDGKAFYFGKIRGMNTNAYPAGTILYASTTVAGGFQTTAPTAPNNIISIAAVTTQGTSNGTILVRPLIGSNINNDEGVRITGATTGDLLQLQASGLWENKSANNAGLVDLAETQTITGAKTFTNGIILGTTGVDAYTISADGLAKSKFNFNGKSFIFDASTIPALATLTYSMPSSSGTLALTSQLHNAVTIGTANGLSLSGQVLSLGLASSINPGALSASDYIAFSSKQNALSVSSPLILSTGPTPNIAIQVATSSQNGYLSSTDWTTFNSKVSSQWTTSSSNIYYNSGNVGIGTTTDAGYKLDVNGTGRFSGNLTIGSTSSGAQANVFSSSYGSNGLFNAYGTDGLLKLQMGGLGTNSAFIYSPSGVGLSIFTGAVERFTIASTGAATFSSSVTAASYTMSSGSPYMTMISSNAGRTYLSGVDSNGYIIYDNTASAYRMVVSPSGNVLIGTTTDNGAKLQVNGGRFFQTGNNVNYQANTTTFANGGTVVFARGVTGYGGGIDDNIAGQIIVSISEPNSNVNSNCAVYVGTVNKPRGADATVTQISKTLGGGISVFTVTNSGSDISVTATSSSASTLRVTLTFIGGGGLS